MWCNLTSEYGYSIRVESGRIFDTRVGWCSESLFSGHFENPWILVVWLTHSLDVWLEFPEGSIVVCLSGYWLGYSLRLTIVCVCEIWVVCSFGVSSSLCFGNECKLDRWLWCLLFTLRKGILVKKGPACTRVFQSTCRNSTCQCPRSLCQHCRVWGNRLPGVRQ